MDKVKDFFEFLNNSTTPYQTVMECEKRLIQAGFIKLEMQEVWSISGWGKYYIKPYDSMLVAFTVAKEMHFLDRFKIITTHNDSPCFKIKPNPEIKEGNVIKLNTEVYGGPILNTWMDRPLSIAGKVALCSEDILKPQIKYLDFEAPLLTIPNQAIHLNRKVNEGMELNKQTDMLPVLGILDEREEIKGYFNKRLAELLSINAEEILGYDMYLYLKEEAELTGANKEIICGPRLDNLAMVYASFYSLINTEPNPKDIQMAVCFNNEEIGSTTIEGADSNLLSIITERIVLSFNKNREHYHRMLKNSFIISADAAHAAHPNALGKNDPTNIVSLNQGIAIKNSAKKSYATDCETSAIIMQLCKSCNLRYQSYVNRSDIPGGMTLGPVTAKYLPIKTADIGVPMWAMHSARESMGKEDFLDMIKLMEVFYGL